LETSRFNMKNRLKSTIKSGDVIRLQRVLKHYLPNEMATLIEDLSPEERSFAFNALDKDSAVALFDFLSFDLQKEFLDILPSHRAAQVLNNLAPDDRTSFLEELPSAVVKELIKLLSDGERALTLRLLGYPEDSVGRLMTPDYISIKPEWTVAQVLDYVRKYGHYSETIEVLYVIDDYGVLIDDLALTDLLFAKPDAHVIDLCDRKFSCLDVYNDQESAANIFLEMNRAALPVTDSQGVLLGIVTIDDILNLINRADTEDMQKIGGMDPLDEPYMKTNFAELMRKRSGWLIVLFFGEMLTTSAMAFFQDALAQVVVLAIFVPLIISSGGNSGSQASTLIVRALALGEIGLKDWWKVIRRELLAGIFLGCVLGFIGFLRIALWSTFSDVYGPHWFLIGCVVGFSLLGVVLWGTLSGSMSPLILKRFGFDPAVSSAPFVATVVDVVGILLYFSTAYLFLSGSLL